MNKKLILLGIIPLAILFLISCQQDKKGTEPIKNVKRGRSHFPNFKERNSGLGSIEGDDTLKIIVVFSDCGEWGGHSEHIYLYRSTKNKITGRIVMDSVSCSNIITKYDSIDKYYYSCIDEKSRKTVLDKRKILSEWDEKIMNLFLHRILELSINKENTDNDIDDTLTIYSDAGRSILIMNTNSTIRLTYNNIDQLTNTWYGFVRKYIFGIRIKKDIRH